MHALLPITLVLATAIAAAPPPATRWSALSQTAVSITGDIRLAPAALGMAGKSYPMSLVRTLDAAHAKTAGSVVSATEPVTAAAVYTISVRHTVELLGGNTLCGGDDARYVVTVRTKTGLALAFYSSAAAPAFATAADPGLCATFSYTRP